MKKRFSEEQIIGFLREADAGMAVKDLCRRHGFREVGVYHRHAQLDGVWRDVVIVERLLS